jgi:hypothetical protein
MRLDFALIRLDLFTRDSHSEIPGLNPWVASLVTGKSDSLDLLRGGCSMFPPGTIASPEDSVPFPPLPLARIPGSPSPRAHSSLPAQCSSPFRPESSIPQRDSTFFQPHSSVAACAQLLECGLLKGSFVPPRVIRDLRNLTRLCKTLVQERGYFQRSCVIRHVMLQECAVFATLLAERRAAEASFSVGWRPARVASRISISRLN